MINFKAFHTFALAAGFICMGSAYASPISNSLGIGNWASTETFDTLTAPVPNSVLASQFDDVSSSELYLDGNSGGAGCVFFQMSDHCVTNFQSDDGVPVAANIHPVFSLHFNTPQTQAIFVMVGGSRDTDTFTALLNGVQVEQFTARLNSNYYSVPGPGNFFGFTDVTGGFNEIQVETRGSNLAAIDTVQFGVLQQSQVSTVPEPGGMVLIAASGIALFAFSKRKPSRVNS